ncbi:MAG: hypothetical protein R3C53_17975 [Pirellulaceae bacterium]
MQTKIVSLLMLLAFSSTSIGNNDSNYSALNRLHLAMQVRSFPKPDDGKIALWMQETPTKGRLRIADRDDWPVIATIKFFDASELTHDLHNIVIISENGKHIRFVDPRNEHIIASRGDVVAILLASKAK